MGRRRDGAAPAAGNAAKPSVESAFERLSHRRHFDVLGRKCAALQRARLPARRRQSRLLERHERTNPMR